MRLFSQRTIGSVLEEAGYRCQNPACEIAFVPLQAHHIFAHSLGGATVERNALLLCDPCHQLVHHGAVPLALAVAWKGLNIEDDPLKSVTDANEVISIARRVPVSDGHPPQARLTTLNRALVAAASVRSRIGRDGAIAEIMLAKAAVLHDAYRVPRIEGERLQYLKRAARVRFRNSLMFGASALYYSERSQSAAGAIRALHYRSAAYRVLGNQREAMAHLRLAWHLCEDAMARGSTTFHPLSNPSRISRALGLQRLRLSATSQLGRREFRRGVNLMDTFAGEEDFGELALQHVEVSFLVGDPGAADTYLHRALNEVPMIGARARALAKRARIEQLFRVGRGDAEAELGNAEEVASADGAVIESLRLADLRRKWLGGH